ncbi:MAG: LCP family protein [Oscillospiraceae bacterium]|nr:LCP family protein [Oscillospiraceae bacterium]
MYATQRRPRRRVILRSCLILLALALVLAGILLILHIWEDQQEIPSGGGDETFSYPDKERPYIWYDGQKYALRENIETLLLMGLDSFEGESVEGYINDDRADFLMLLLIDRDAGTCTSLHIDRDTMADVQVMGVAGQVLGVEKMQLALAHTYGSGKQDSCRNTVQAVSAFLYETPIDHYLSVTMDAVQILNDAVDGVTLTVLDDMTSIDPSLKQGAEVTLRGELALKYVRTRSGLEDSTNRHRMERQRQYMNALYENLSARYAADRDFALRTMLKISDYLVSDCPPSQLSDLLDEASTYKFVGIDTIEGESIVGEKFMEFYPDEEKLMALIIELFYEPLSE